MSTYWPDCTLSTSLRGNGADAGDKIRPELLTMGVICWLVTGVCRGTCATFPVAAGVLGEEIGAELIVCVKGTDVSAWAGGRAPRVAKKG